MYPEEETHWGYAAYSFGALISSGSNPIPDDLRELIEEQATEIRWVLVDPNVVPEPKPVPDDDRTSVVMPGESLN